MLHTQQIQFPQDAPGRAIREQPFQHGLRIVLRIFHREWEIQHGYAGAHGAAGIQRAVQQLQKCGFAAPVAAGKAEPPVGVQHERDVLEHVVAGAVIGEGKMGNGDLGHIYGYQWRSWPDYNGGHIDQITEAVETIKHNPDSRRIIVSAWNVADLPQMNLPPCHAFFQFYVANGRLSLQLYQRSADIFLGVPFNIASYALLLKMMAQVTGLKAGDFVHTLGDAHIYSNHIEQVKLQLTRAPRPLPQIEINPNVKDIFGFKYEDFTLTGYDPHPHIKGEVAV